MDKETLLKNLEKIGKVYEMREEIAFIRDNLPDDAIGRKPPALSNEHVNDDYMKREDQITC